MTLDPDAANVLEMVRKAGRPPYESMTPPEARDAYRAVRDVAALPTPPIDLIKDFAADGPHGPIPVRLYRPKNAGHTALPVLVFFHGGGWVLGYLDALDATCAQLANASGCAVVSVDYRLAPENKFPKAVDDAYASTAWVAVNAKTLGIDPTRIAVGGDSAGGNLAAVVCLMARQAGGKPSIKYQLLIYPVTDAAMDTPSFRRFAQGYLLTSPAMAWFYRQYLNTPDERRDWRCSPMRAASLANLPPAFVMTAGFDPLRDEGEEYAARLAREAHVPVTLWRHAGQIHGFLPMGKLIAAASPTIEKLGAALKAAL
ncbi:MAG: alpha/beta hydrolase [Rhodospirillaceae bacterium]|nr:alpha/beta hydrolase [Rhodospirillaceae bacterium]